MPNLAALTSLRFLAALAIGVFHLQGTLGLGSAYAPLANGVSFFFVLSGFILAYTYGHSAIKLRDFYLKRIARIWPIHLATWAFALVAFNAGMLHDQSWWTFAVSNAMMLQAWVPKEAHAMSFNSVSWSLSAEAFFYLAFPVLMLANRKGTVAIVLTVVSVAAALAFDLVGYPAGPKDPWELAPATFILHNPALRLAEFAVGVWAGNLFLTRANPRLKGSIAEFCAVGAVVLFAVTSLAVKGLLRDTALPHLGIWYHQCAGAGAFALLVYVFASGAGILSRVLSRPFLVWLGEISFCFYMVHLLVMVWAMNNQWVDRFGWGASVFAVVALSFGIAAAAWRLVEVPARRAILKLPSRLRFTPAGVAS